MATEKKHLLTDEQVKQFQEEGFLVVKEFFSKEELQPVIDYINSMVDEVANDLIRAKKIENPCKDEGFYTRLSKLEEQFPGAVVLPHKKGLLSTALANLWTHPRLLDVVEQVLGPEIAGHPVWNIRTKTPNNPTVTVPWHQDAAYLNPGCENTLQPTAWIPLIDANAENGCMQVYKYGHRAAKLCEHECCAGPSWYISIPEETIKPTLGDDLEIVTCEVPFGGFLLINQLIPHRSLENTSNKIRWSVDLRWQRPNEPHGFFGSKEPLLFRTAKDPAYKPDWNVWGPLDTPVQQSEEEKLSTIISGPWMKRWKITHHNKHTDRSDSTSDWTGGHKS
jgi:ectoine hydroxylase-related dioxygenase (phytanoyl-CoA dioxygenase family)